MFHTPLDSSLHELIIGMTYYAIINQEQIEKDDLKFKSSQIILIILIIDR
jgi:hypothetical protein